MPFANDTKFLRIHRIQILTEYVCQVWWQSDRNYEFYEVFEILNKSISIPMRPT